MATIDLLNRDKLPSHVAVIMDGNGRWAEQKGNDRIFGHQNGVIAVRETVEAAAELGIGYLTLYAFSTENWNRPREEIDALMSLLVLTIQKEIKILKDNNIRLRVIGDTNSLPSKVKKKLLNAIDQTKSNTGLNLILALSYSGRWEIVNAMRNIAKDAEAGNISTHELSCEIFNRYLSTAEIPDPELLIRTSGEYRISNFLLWQIAYTELYFTEILWPDFRKEHFFEALLDYQKRERRFGKISAQVKGE